MLGFFLNLLVSGLAVFVSAYFLPGVKVDSFVTALIVAVVLGLVNAFINFPDLTSGFLRAKFNEAHENSNIV